MKPIILPAFLFLICCSSCDDPAADTTEDLSAEIATIENGLPAAIQIKGETPKTYTLAERMEFYKVPGVSIAVVKDGKLRWAKGYGTANTATGKAVDTTTLFQAGSISKPVAALSVLKLAEQGKVNLDQDVNSYLKDWKVPDSKFTQTEKVSLRRLLTHNAGMTVHGFPGYSQTDSFPSDIDVLNGKGNTPAIFVDTLPGAIWRYSGGGYTVAERVVENVTGMPFEVYMRDSILHPMGLHNSTYAQPLPEELHEQAGAAYDGQGNLIDGLWHNYPEQAAAGLWTTAADLARYGMHIQQIAAGKTDGLLSPETVEQMLTKHKNDWGLGPSLGWDADSLLFRHGGKNAGFTNQMVAFARRGDAVIIMTNADRGGELMGEILRAISAYYQLGIEQPRTIEPISLTEEALHAFTGNYKYSEQLPGISDYLIQFIIREGQLVAIDTNDGTTHLLLPLEPMKFVDVERGEELTFQKEDGALSFLLNNRDRFIKVD